VLVDEVIIVVLELKLLTSILLNFIGDIVTFDVFLIGEQEIFLTGALILHETFFTSKMNFWF